MIIMKKKTNISGNYTDEERKCLEDMINAFRIKIGDFAEKNIINKKQQYYTDEHILELLNLALGDFNGTPPLTHYTIFTFGKKYDEDFLVDGAIIFALQGEGILQLRNQVNINDSGVSINLNDKTQLYQGWLGFLLQQYTSAKEEYKALEIPQSGNMFVGVSSEFALYGDDYWYD